MSRIGNRVILIPEGVTVTVDNGIVTVTGPKGTLTEKLLKGLIIKQADGKLTIERENDLYKPNHGTMNSLITNMIKGVTKGYEKGLEIVGVGYRFNVQGKKLVINAGYSHPVEIEVPEDITVEAPSNTELKIKSIDKIKLGEFAANVRKVRLPEPYKGKGIRYKDEHIRRKEGKKAAK